MTKKLITSILCAGIILSCTAMADNTNNIVKSDDVTNVGSEVFDYEIPAIETLCDKAKEFASQYPYKEGDVEKTFALYPDIAYTSGIEKKSDGTEYECPAIYNDEHALYFNSYDLKKGDMTIVVFGEESEYSHQCILYNGVTLVPAGVFAELDCNISFNKELYVLTISKNDVILEIVPHLIGMRKNQTEGYYVPLRACARYLDGELYVPVRAISEEFGINVGWNGESYTVTLD